MSYVPVNFSPGDVVRHVAKGCLVESLGASPPVAPGLSPKRLFSFLEVRLNYYQHHIGDFRSGTVSLTREERWIYRDLLDLYYDKESPIPLDLEVVYHQLGINSDTERAIISKLLRFKFRKDDDGYHNERCDKEIADYRSKAEQARKNGKSGGRPKAENLPVTNPEPIRNPAGSQNNPAATGLKANQEPLTSITVPKGTGADAPKDWVFSVGLSLLTEAGQNVKNARKILGALCRDHGDANVHAALQDVGKRRCVDPVSALMAKLTGKTSKQSQSQAWVNDLLGQKGDVIDGTAYEVR